MSWIAWLLAYGVLAADVPKEQVWPQVVVGCTLIIAGAILEVFDR